MFNKKKPEAEAAEAVAEAGTETEVAEVKSSGDEISEAELSSEETGGRVKRAEADKVEKVREQLMRTMAEFDNFRKRTQKENAEYRPKIVSEVVTEFLPVLDNLERALAVKTEDESFKKGVELIQTAFLESLRRLGVAEIPSEQGTEFDPSVQQAVQQVQSDEAEKGKIVTVFQKGYKIGDKVIRFAMVSVGA